MKISMVMTKKKIKTIIEDDKKKDKKVVAINRKKVMKKDMKEIRSRRMTEESKIEKRKSWRERERTITTERKKIINLIKLIAKPQKENGKEMARPLETLRLG